LLMMIGGAGQGYFELMKYLMRIRKLSIIKRKVLIILLSDYCKSHH